MGAGGGTQIMGRSPGPRPVQVLYIGRGEAAYQRVWQSLEQEGVAAAFENTQKAGIQRAWELKPHVVVVDAANASFSGVRLCRMLGRRLPQTRRLLIALRGEGAHIECEERLTPPFTRHKLIEILHKLVDSIAPNTLKAGVLELDRDARVVCGPVGRIPLTPKQCDLLAALMQRPNQVISRADLMRDIWDTSYVADTRTLDVHVRWLRERIEPDPTRPTLLVTQRSVGYKLVVPVCCADEEAQLESDP